MSKPLLIGNIQILRAFAALSVVFHHTNYRIVEGVLTDFQAVGIFFMISGFIMAHITVTDSSRFLLRRLTRIVPLYWIMTLVAFGGYIAAYWLKHDQINLSGNGGFVGLLKSMLFIPYRDLNGDFLPTLPVGWTLNLEMFFYGLIAVTLPFFHRNAVIVVGIILILLNVLYFFVGSSHDLLVFYAQFYTLYFACGIALYYVWQWMIRFPLARNASLLVPIAFVTGLLFILVNLLGSTSFLLCVLVVLVALLLSSAGKDCVYPPALLLGDASYAIYLVHIPLRYMAQQLAFLDFEHNFFAFSIIMLVSSLAGIALHLCIEKPLLKALRLRYA